MEPIFFMEIYNYKLNQNIKNKENKKVDNESEQKYKQNNVTNQCNHKFVKDMIDITPDQSMNICYCVKCGFTR